jgi:hypothetical protein
MISAANVQEQLTSSYSSDRRSGTRHTLVLRVAIISDGDRASLCLLRNISNEGVQIKAYCTLEVGTPVEIIVAEEDPIGARIAWVEDRLAGVSFNHKLPLSTLLRVKQQTKEGRRRTSPRVNTESLATLRTCGRAYRVNLTDISTTGAKLQTRERLPPSGSAVLVLPDMPPLSAFIRWSDDHDLGLSFSSPLPLEVISRWLIGRRHVSVSS